MSSLSIFLFSVSLRVKVQLRGSQHLIGRALGAHLCFISQASMGTLQRNEHEAVQKAIRHQISDCFPLLFCDKLIRLWRVESGVSWCRWSVLMCLGDVFSTFHYHFNVQYFLVDYYSTEFHFEMSLL